ncbi:AraC family transcriptional regulator [Oceanobacter antarcticus]|jgi:AraC-like DNA-binding protein|uniref:AraC family transcriptional regulator n=1 Tax=Oceanobacter antarcticus TaxID=3133425 RepID=A0ABW8NIL3_9GAMM
MTFERSSISMHYARTIAAAARRHGLDDQKLLADAGLDPTLVVATRGPRMTSEQFAALLLGYWRCANDEFLGQTRTPGKHGTFALMAKQAVNARNLRGVYRHISRFYDLFTEEFQLTLREEGNEAWFEMTLTHPQLDTDHLFTEFFLLLWHRFPGWLIGRFIPLIRVQVSYPRPAHGREYRLIFPAEVTFDQPRIALVFDRQLLNEPLVQTEDTLRNHLENAPLVWVTRPNFFPHYTRKVTNYLTHCLHTQHTLSQASMETAATELHVTSRTLRRKLTQEKTSFQALKDKVRQDLAIQLLNQPELTISQISQRLGFSDPAAFTRAFKSWLGIPPKEYRKSG